MHFIVLNVPKGAMVFWDMGSSQFSGKDMDTVFYAFPLAGKYQPSVTVVDLNNDTCRATLDDTVVVSAPIPKPGLFLNKSVFCQTPARLELKTDAKRFSSIQWIIGRQSFKTSVDSFSLSLTQTGYFDVGIRLVDSFGCSRIEIIDSAAFVMSEPSLDFTYKSILPNSCGKKQIELDPLFNRDPKTFADVEWSFPGARQASVKGIKPSDIHYQDTGSFSIIVSVSGKGGCLYSRKFSDTIRVVASKEIKLAIPEPDICAGADGLIVNQSDKLEEGEWSWDFDGAFTTSLPSADTQAVVFSTGSWHHINVTHSLEGCTTSYSQKQAFKVTRVEAQLLGGKSCGCTWPDTFSFIGRSTSSKPNDAVVSVWDLLDSNGKSVDAIKGLNAEFIVREPGAYRVRLKAENSAGCSDSSFEDLALRPLTASVISSAKAVCVGSELTFEVNPFITCLDEPVEYSWHFISPTGAVLSNSKQAEPQLSFQDTGHYKVALSIKNSLGCSDSILVDSAVHVFRPKLSFSTTEGDICTNERVLLNSEVFPEFDNIQYRWLVTPSSGGIGINGGGEQLDFRFKTTGIYDVQLRISDQKGCEDSLTIPAFFTVEGVEPSFDLFDTTGCIPFASTPVNVKNRGKDVRFQDLQIKWEVSPPSGVDVEHADSVAPTLRAIEAGVYDLSLRLTDSIGCTGTVTKKSALQLGVIADFKVSPINCVNVPFGVSDKSMIGPSNYSWSLIPDSIGKILKPEDRSPEILIKEPGKFKIQLKVSNSTGCTDSTQENVLITQFEAQFTSPDTLGACSPAIIQFDAQAVNVDSFIWILGDGGVERVTRPSLGYLYDLARTQGPLPEAFTVSLIYKSDYGCVDTFTRESYIPINGPRLSFDQSDSIGTDSLSVRFIDKSARASLVYFDYGGGGSLDSNMAVFSHTYIHHDPTKPYSAFLPKMIGFDDQGCRGEIQAKDSIRVYDAAIPEIKLGRSKSCDTLTVFMKGSARFSNQLSWDIGDDGVIDGLGTDYRHSFKPGMYSIRLISRNGAGDTSSVLLRDTIGVYRSPLAGFMVDTAVCVGEELAFKDASQGFNGGLQRRWRFGDGQVSSQNNPTHQYRLGGSFEVSLHVEDAIGCKDSSRLLLHVRDTVFPEVTGIRKLSFNADNELGIFLSNHGLRSFQSIIISQADSGGALPQRQFDPTPWRDSGVIVLAMRVEVQRGYQARMQALDICGGAHKLGVEHSPIFLSSSTANGYLPKLSWTRYKGYPGQLQYSIFRKNTITKEIRLLRSFKEETLEYVDSMACDSSYEYWVLATDSFTGFSSRSLTLKITPDYKRPDSRVEMACVTWEEEGALRIKWFKAREGGKAEYVLLRKVLGGAKLNEVAVTSDTQYVDRDLASAEGLKYEYQVRLTDQCGKSSPVSLPTGNMILTSTSKGAKVGLQWSAFQANGLRHNYQVQVRGSEDSIFRPLMTLSPDLLEFEDGESYSSQEKPFRYQVQVLASHPVYGTFQCRSNPVKVFPKPRIFVPTAFTPNDDGLNEQLKPSLSGLPVSDAEYEFTILNRWGQIIFQTRDVNEGWDGKIGSEEAPLQVYIYKVQAKDYNGVPLVFSGTFSLIR